MTPPVRQPQKLCGAPFTTGHDDIADEDEVIYCGLEFAHRPPHIAMLWWFDDEASPLSVSKPHPDDEHGEQQQAERSP